jgi:hypothetical protein
MEGGNGCVFFISLVFFELYCIYRLNNPYQRPRCVHYHLDAFQNTTETVKNGGVDENGPNDGLVVVWVISRGFFSSFFVTNYGICSILGLTCGKRAALTKTGPNNVVWASTISTAIPMRPPRSQHLTTTYRASAMS